MKRLTKRFTLFAIPVLGLSIALSVGAEVYKWKDKDGKLHFSDRPPPSQSGIQLLSPKRLPSAVSSESRLEEKPDTAQAGEEGKVSAPDEAVDSASGQKNPAEQRDEEFRKRRAAALEAQEKAEKEATRVAQRRQDCQRARAQHSALSGGMRMVRPTEDGGREFISEEERAAELARAQKLIDESCAGD